MNKLAIIIPYFKVQFFDELLLKLSEQTDKRFNIYIGNDSSREDPIRIINKYTDKLKIKYKHYNENLGHICPTLQWNRCLDLISEEEWVWILPDDDLISENCVEEFYKALPEIENQDINVITIPSQTIDAHGFRQDNLRINPKIQSVYQFYLKQLKGESTGSSLGDNIFRRSALLTAGKFFSFPRAWGSDHATILASSAKSNIYCLQEAWFGFRQSGLNISSSNTDGDLKMEARLRFLKWLKNNEYIFNTKPSIDFYKYFYWKSEYYMLNEWRSSIPIYWTLFQIRKHGLNSTNPTPIIKIIIKKLISRLIPFKY